MSTAIVFCDVNNEIFFKIIIQIFKHIGISGNWNNEYKINNSPIGLSIPLTFSVLDFFINPSDKFYVFKYFHMYVLFDFNFMQFKFEAEHL